MGAELDGMTTHRKPQEPFAMLPRDLLRSDAWRSLGINERRLIDFLLLEHMRHGGRENGKLKAPWLQLVEFGAAKNQITGAIRKVEDCGLVLCERGGCWTTTLYTVTWVPLPNGSMPEQPWRHFRDPAVRPLSTPKIRNQLPKQGPNHSLKREQSRESVPKAGVNPPFSAPESLPEKGVPSRYIYQGLDPSPAETGGDAPADAAVVPLRAAGNPR
jgi:hypothetical protein